MFVASSNNFFIENTKIYPIVSLIHSLVRENAELISDQQKLFATKMGTFILIMNSWGWNVSTDIAGNIVGLDYFGKDSINYQKVLFENIAMHIKAGCIINLQAGEIKKTWIFNGHQLIEN